MKDDPKKENPGSSPPSSSFPNIESGRWEDAPNSKCHASFGEHGTTATIGTFGQLIQFSDHLNAGTSGMFCADHASTPEPYYVKDRATKLHELLQQPFHCGWATTNVSSPTGTVSSVNEESIYGEKFAHGNPRYGLRFPGLAITPNTQPNLKWLHWRWPCHEYSRGQFRSHSGLGLTIQWMVRNKTVLQRCIFENSGNDDVNLDLEFGKSMVIRDLDHINPHYNFNKETCGNHDIRPGPGGYSWVCIHKFNTEQGIYTSCSNTSV